MKMTEATLFTFLIVFLNNTPISSGISN